MATASEFLIKSQRSIGVALRLDFVRTIRNRWERFTGKGNPGRYKWRIRFCCMLLMLVVAVIGTFTKGHVSITAMYSVPIALLAWFTDVTSALVLSFLSTAIFVLTVGTPEPWSLPRPEMLGVALFRLSFYAATSIAMARLSHLHHHLQEIAEIRAKALATEISNREHLEREMLEISEHEQRRIGQDLHDGLCQLLTGATLAGNAYVRRLQAQGRAPESDDIVRFVSYVEKAILEAKSIANGLDPMDLQKHGLMGALEQLADMVSDLFGIKCQFNCHLPVLMENLQTATHLYRIAQEAVGNAFKHGGATIIDINLAETDTAVVLCVIDNGCGFLPEQSMFRGRGLRTMTVRSKLIGGHLSILPSKSRGMEVTCSVPMDLWDL